MNKSHVFRRFGRSIDALGNRTEMVYNRGGQLLEQRDPMGRVTRFVYDALGRRVEIILPAPKPGEKNPVRKTVYNVLGQVVQEIDPLGNATTTEYDAFGRRAAVIDAEGGRTEFTYNATGKMLSLKDPVGNVTSWVYDDAGRMVEETNELGKTRRFEYEGRLPVRKTDRNGRVTAFEYNDLGRPVAEKWLGIDGKVERIIASQYDALGKLEQVADLDSTHTFVYDDLDRNTLMTMQLTGLEMPITFKNQFDDANRRTHVAAKIGGIVDHVNQYAYDALGRVTGISQGEKRVDYAYNAVGQRTATSVFAGGDRVFDTLYGYDGMGRLMDLTHSNGEKVFANYDYSWDIANRITGFDFSYLGEKEEKTAEHGYDQTSQLVAADYNAFQPNEAYQYDANGNRKNFETGANNQLTNDGEFCYTYDSEGNRVEKMSIATGEKTKYVWDHRNRLTQVVTPKESVAYSYDYLNRTTRRNSEFVVHDGWQIVLTCDARGAVKDRNLWGANQDELIATNDQFTLCDHLGSVRDVVDASGKVLNHIEYNAFGKITKQTGKSTSVFGYTGKMFDDATGLQWNINRWYDSNVGRWVSEDPIGFEADDTNLYRYVDNVPVLYSDAFGWFEVSVSVYKGLGGGVSVSIQKTEKDCCDEHGNLIPNGFTKHEAEFTVTFGLGIGGSVSGYGREISLQYTSHQIVRKAKVTVESPRCGVPPRKICYGESYGVLLGMSLSGGIAIFSITGAAAVVGSFNWEACYDIDSGKLSGKGWWNGTITVSLIGRVGIELRRLPRRLRRILNENGVEVGRDIPIFDKTFVDKDAVIFEF